MSLRKELIKLANENPELRKHLVPILRTAMEFPTEDALKKYLDDHPDADRSIHKVKKQEPKEEAKKDEKKPKSPKDEYKAIFIDMPASEKATKTEEEWKNLWDNEMDDEEKTDIKGQANKKEVQDNFDKMIKSKGGHWDNLDDMTDDLKKFVKKEKPDLNPTDRGTLMKMLERQVRNNDMVDNSRRRGED